jgi:peptidoglycan/xylan/chitin deacetylase (PgdA/CDA1 family)
MDDRRNFLQWEEIAALHRMGFEVGNHSMHHVALHDPDPLEALDREVQTLEEGLARVGVPKPISFSWPGNHFGPRSAKRLRELGYRFARRGPVPDVPPDVPVVGMGPVYDPQRYAPMLIPTSGLAVPSWTLDDFRKVVAPAREGTAIVLQFHGTPDGAHPFCSTPADRFKEFLDYLAREQYTVVAMRDLEKYIDVSQKPPDPLLQEMHFFK